MGFRTTVFPRQTKGDHRRAGRMPAGEIRRNRPPAPTCSPTSPREVPCLPNSSLRPMPPSKRLRTTRKPCLTSISVLRASQGHHTLCTSSSGPWFGPPAQTAGLNLAPTSPFSPCRAVYDRCRVFDHVGDHSHTLSNHCVGHMSKEAWPPSSAIKTHRPALPARRQVRRNPAHTGRARPYQKGQQRMNGIAVTILEQLTQRRHQVSITYTASPTQGKKGMAFDAVSTQNLVKPNCCRLAPSRPLASEP